MTDPCTEIHTLVLHGSTIQVDPEGVGLGLAGGEGQEGKILLGWGLQGQDPHLLQTFSSHQLDSYHVGKLDPIPIMSHLVPIHMLSWDLCTCLLSGVTNWHQVQHSSVPESDLLMQSYKTKADP